MNKYLSIPELRRKGEYYCSYQERCHAEVYKKLKTYTSSNTDINEVISKLIADDFLNETRFSESFVRGKFKNKNWGKIRLILELKKRSVSKKNIEIIKNINLENQLDFQDSYEFNGILLSKKNQISPILINEVTYKKNIDNYNHYR